jgi:uncharacterized membrane protein
MESDRGIERLIFFTDAVVAIAITLLILPLVDVVPAYAAGKGHTLTGFLVAHKDQFFAFGLSFLIIARLWLSNHGILLNTARVTHPFIWLDLAWVFTIVVLPLPTQFTASFTSSELQVAIYMGTCFASTLLLTAMAFYLYRRPELERTHTTVSGMQLWNVASGAGAFVVAFAILVIYPPASYYSLLALLLSTPVGWIVRPRIRRHDEKRAIRLEQAA